MYERDGRESPVSTLWGLWFLLPIIGHFIWYFKVQAALERLLGQQRDAAGRLTASEIRAGEGRRAPARPRRLPVPAPRCCPCASPPPLRRWLPGGSAPPSGPGSGLHGCRGRCWSGSARINSRAGSKGMASLSPSTTSTSSPSLPASGWTVCTQRVAGLERTRLTSSWTSQVANPSDCARPALESGRRRSGPSHVFRLTRLSVADHEQPHRTGTLLRPDFNVMGFFERNRRRARRAGHRPRPPAARPVPHRTLPGAPRRRRPDLRRRAVGPAGHRSGRRAVRRSSWDELRALPSVTAHHRHPLRHEVVEVRHRRGPACRSATSSSGPASGRRPPTSWSHAEYGYTANLPLDDVTPRRLARRLRVRRRAHRAHPRRPGAPRRPASLLLEVGKWVRASSCAAGDDAGLLGAQRLPHLRRPLPGAALLGRLTRSSDAEGPQAGASTSGSAGRRSASTSASVVVPARR